MENREIDLSWWKALEPQWKNAFAITVFSHANQPTRAELRNLYYAPALRFAGPTAPYPNMQFELSNLSGIARLHNLEILVVIHQQVESIDELKDLPKLKNIFLLNNKIKNLDSLQEHLQLEQLYVQHNHIESIQPLRKLTKLKELYINNNNISSLEGLTEEHAENLNIFVCKPNDALKQKEILRVERELGIKCRGL